MGIVSLKDYRWDGSKKLELKDAETGAPEFVDKKRRSRRKRWRTLRKRRHCRISSMRRGVRAS